MVKAELEITCTHNGFMKTFACQHLAIDGSISSFHHALLLSDRDVDASSPRGHNTKDATQKQRLKSVRELIYKRGYGKLNKQTIPLANNKVIEQGLGAGEDDIAILACLLLLGDSLLLLLELNSRRLLEVGYSGLRMRAERLWKAKKVKDSSGPVLAGACGQGRIGGKIGRAHV